MSIGIYCITNLLTNKRYVGQSINIEKRWSAYREPKGNKGCVKIMNAINKYGIGSFEFKIIQECKKEELNELECFWINELKTLSPCGYNLKHGGGRPILSEETKRKISETKKKNRYKPSEETKNKTRTSMMGKKFTNRKPFSEEAKINMSKSRKGKKRTKETCENIKKSKLGNQYTKGIKHNVTSLKNMKNAHAYRQKPVINSNGDVFPSAKIASEILKISRTSIVAALTGRSKTCLDLTWHYYKEDIK